MRRRNFLLTSMVAYSQSGGGKPREWVTATASRDTAPRVGLIPSTFTGGVELDGRKIRGLARPAPLNAELTAAQVDDMLRLAVELGGGRRGGLVTAIDRDDWVLVKAGAGADPRVVASVLRFLAEKRLGKRITVVGGTGGEILDLATAPRLEMPVEGRAFGKQERYRIPRALRECDKVISIAGLGKTMMNYLEFAGETTGDPGAAAVDLFSFHPAEYAIGSGTGTRHNGIVAATNATAVDAVGVAVLGQDSTKIPYLEMAVHRGYGSNDSASIWTRGAEVEEVATR